MTKKAVKQPTQSTSARRSKDLKPKKDIKGGFLGKLMKKTSLAVKP